jgi:hypothetical protein
MEPPSSGRVVVAGDDVALRSDDPMDLRTR